MKFVRRLLFYIIGIGLGYLLVNVFFGDRDLDFAYGAEARVKKKLRTTSLDSASLVQPLLDLSKDSLYYRAVVDGDIDFSKSEQRKEPCGEYALLYSHESYPYLIRIENCEDEVRVLSVEHNELDREPSSFRLLLYWLIGIALVYGLFSALKFFLNK